MKATTMETTDRIRELNDSIRTTLTGGRILLTPGVSSLTPQELRNVLAGVCAFSEFTGDNDPWGEHDFGAIEVGGQRYFWKIDYYAPDLLHGSDDPSDPAVTWRVLTIMRADEY